VESACWLAARSALLRSPMPGQGETVVERPAERLVGVARTVQGREEEVTGAVSREHPPRPVASVGCRGKPDNHEPRVRIAEAGQRTRPVPFCEMGDRGLDAASWRQAVSLGQREQFATSRPICSKRAAVDPTSQRLRCRSCRQLA